MTQEIYTSFTIAKKLAKKDFHISKFNKPPFTTEWYSSNGEITNEPTQFPRVKYSVIEQWLESEGVLYSVHRPQPESHLFGQVFVRIYDGQEYPPGKEPYRRWGHIDLFDNFEIAEVATIERAISAVIPLPF
ncbi:MAG: hypothetical protein K2L30_09795 [Duncaniella sp.]|nr:hypothetical protein [Duncaniella sp.]